MFITTIYTNDIYLNTDLLMLYKKINIGSIKDGCYYAAPFMAIELIFSRAI